MSSPAQLVAIDLDGTLLRDDKTIAPETLEALNGLTRRGLPIIIASARPPRSIKPFHEQLNLTTPVVAYNGALIWRFSPPDTLGHWPLHGPLVQAITAAARNIYPDCLLNIEASDRWITDRLDHRYQTQTARLFPADVVEPIEQWHGEPATKVLVQGDPGPLAHVKFELIARFTGLANVVSTEPDCLQIMLAGIDKSSGVSLIASQLHVPPEAVLAIGDNDNDAEMLAVFGYSACMDTGTPLAKRSARVIVGSHNGPGIVEALQYAGLL